jgi:hypothetical protein
MWPPSKERDKKLADDAKLTRWWRRWRGECVAAALQGPHGGKLAVLIEFLKKMKLGHGQDLVDLIVDQGWSREDLATRELILRVVGEQIVALRLRHDLVPFSDSIPFSDEEPTAYEVIRTILIR